MANRNSVLAILLCLELVLCSAFLPSVQGDQKVLGINKTPPIDPVIGISLGNTNSRVAFFEWKSGTAHFILNSQGHNATPNYFAFNESSYLIGDEAKALAGISDNPVISGFTKYLGHNFTSMRSLTGLGENDLVDRDGVPKYRVQPPFGDVVEYSPVELTVFLLQSLKQDAERYLGTKVEHAVIVTGHIFDEAHRSEIKEAGKIAGLDVLRVLQRPTTVGLGYELDTIAWKNKGIVLIYHLGGSFIEVSVVEIEDGIFETLSVSYGTHENPTAGKLTQQIIEFIVDTLNPLDSLDPVERRLKSTELQLKADQVQRILSFQNEAKIEDGGKSVILSRSKFEQLLDNDLKRTLMPVNKALTEAKVSVSEIDAIILSGGSTNIPKVKAMLREHLGKPVLEGKNFNHEEAAVKGAAVQASVLLCNSCGSETLSERTFGVETIDGYGEKIVPSWVSVPSWRSGIFTTATDNQTKAVVNILEWVSRSYICRIGTLTLNDIPPAPAGKHQIEISFKIEKGKILTVTAIYQQIGRLETTLGNTTLSIAETGCEKELSDIFEAEDEGLETATGKLVMNGKIVGKDEQIRRLYMDKPWGNEEL